MHKNIACSDFLFNIESSSILGPSPYEEIRFVRLMKKPGFTIGAEIKPKWSTFFIPIELSRFKQMDQLFDFIRCGNNERIAMRLRHLRDGNVCILFDPETGYFKWTSSDEVFFKKNSAPRRVLSPCVGRNINDAHYTLFGTEDYKSYDDVKKKYYHIRRQHSHLHRSANPENTDLSHQDNAYKILINPSLRLSYAENLLEAGNFDRFEKELDFLQSISPRNPWVIKYKIEYFMRSNDLKSLKNYVSDLIKYQKDSQFKLEDCQVFDSPVAILPLKGSDDQELDLNSYICVLEKNAMKRCEIYKDITEGFFNNIDTPEEQKKIRDSFWPKERFYDRNLLQKIRWIAENQSQIDIFDRATINLCLLIPPKDYAVFSVLLSEVSHHHFSNPSDVLNNFLPDLWLIWRSVSAKEEADLINIKSKHCIISLPNFINFNSEHKSALKKYLYTDFVKITRDNLFSISFDDVQLHPLADFIVRLHRAIGRMYSNDITFVFEPLLKYSNAKIDIKNFEALRLGTLMLNILGCLKSQHYQKASECYDMLLNQWDFGRLSLQNNSVFQHLLSCKNQIDQMMKNQVLMPNYDKNINSYLGAKLRPMLVKTIVSLSKKFDLDQRITKFVTHSFDNENEGFFAFTQSMLDRKNGLTLYNINGFKKHKNPQNHSLQQITPLLFRNYYVSIMEMNNSNNDGFNEGSIKNQYKIMCSSFDELYTKPFYYDLGYLLGSIGQYKQGQFFWKNKELIKIFSIYNSSIKQSKNSIKLRLQHKEKKNIKTCLVQGTTTKEINQHVCFKQTSYLSGTFFYMDPFWINISYSKFVVWDSDGYIKYVFDFSQEEINYRGYGYSDKSLIILSAHALYKFNFNFDVPTHIDMTPIYEGHRISFSPNLCPNLLNHQYFIFISEINKHCKQKKYLNIFDTASNSLVVTEPLDTFISFDCNIQDIFRIDNKHFGILIKRLEKTELYIFCITKEY